MALLRARVEPYISNATEGDPLPQSSIYKISPGLLYRFITSVSEDKHLLHWGGISGLALDFFMKYGGPNKQVIC